MKPKSDESVSFPPIILIRVAWVSPVCKLSNLYNKGNAKFNLLSSISLLIPLFTKYEINKYLKLVSYSKYIIVLLFFVSRLNIYTLEIILPLLFLSFLTKLFFLHR